MAHEIKILLSAPIDEKAIIACCEIAEQLRGTTALSALSLPTIAEALKLPHDENPVCATFHGNGVDFIITPTSTVSDFLEQATFLPEGWVSAYETLGLDTKLHTIDEIDILSLKYPDFAEDSVLTL